MHKLLRRRNFLPPSCTYINTCIFEVVLNVGFIPIRYLCLDLKPTRAASCTFRRVFTQRLVLCSVPTRRIYPQQPVTPLPVVLDSVPKRTCKHHQITASTLPDHRLQLHANLTVATEIFVSQKFKNTGPLALWRNY